jgi:hypothetical protein
MPPKNDPPHRHLKQGPRAPRKSKPKFEIPMDAGVPVGWVYRAYEVPAPAPVASREIQENSKTNGLLGAGIGLFLIGAGTMGFVGLAAIGLMATPILLATRMLSQD